MNDPLAAFEAEADAYADAVALARVGNTITGRDALKSRHFVEHATKVMTDRLNLIDELTIAVMMTRWQEAWGKPVLLMRERTIRSTPGYKGSYDTYMEMFSGLIGLCTNESAFPLVTVAEVRVEVGRLYELIASPAVVSPE